MPAPPPAPRSRSRPLATPRGNATPAREVLLPSTPWTLPSCCGKLSYPTRPCLPLVTRPTRRRQLDQPGLASHRVSYCLAKQKTRNVPLHYSRSANRPCCLSARLTTLPSLTPTVHCSHPARRVGYTLLPSRERVVFAFATVSQQTQRKGGASAHKVSIPWHRQERVAHSHVLPSTRRTEVMTSRARAATGNSRGYSPRPPSVLLLTKNTLTSSS
jgi:hypothetical protein